MIPSSRQLILNLIAGFSKHYPFSFLGTCFLIGAVAFSYIITFRNHSNSQGCLSPSFFGFQVSTTMYHNIEHSDKPCFWSYEIVDESFLYHISAGLCIHFQLFYLRGTQHSTGNKEKLHLISNTQIQVYLFLSPVPLLNTEN